MGIYKRADGNYLKNLPSYIKFFPFLMTSRNSAAVYFSQQIDLTKTVSYCEKNNTKIFHIFIAALVRVAAERPAFNRFVVGKRLYQRNAIIIGFMAKQELTEEAQEISVKVHFEPTDRLQDVQEKIKEKVDVVKSGSGFAADDTIETLLKLPKFVTSFIFFFMRLIDHFGLLTKSFIDENPLYTSAYVTNVGSIGLDAPFHHMYEWGTTSVFAALGKIHPDCIIKDGEITITDVVNVNFTVDERIADGIYMAKSLGYFKTYMENPELLEQA